MSSRQNYTLSALRRGQASPWEVDVTRANDDGSMTLLDTIPLSDAVLPARRNKKGRVVGSLAKPGGGGVPKLFTQETEAVLALFRRRRREHQSSPSSTIPPPIRLWVIVACWGQALEVLKCFIP